jgi:hypothetical protein
VGVLRVAPENRQKPLSKQEHIDNTAKQQESFSEKMKRKTTGLSVSDNNDMPPYELSA